LACQQDREFPGKRNGIKFSNGLEMFWLAQWYRLLKTIGNIWAAGVESACQKNWEYLG
jgi:hypothetical protein